MGAKRAYSECRRYNQSEARLRNIHWEKMRELEEKLGVTPREKKPQHFEIINNGEPISDELVNKQLAFIERNTTISGNPSWIITENEYLYELHKKLNK